MGSDIRRAKSVVVRWRRVLSWGHQTFSARRLPGDLANVHPATGSTPVRFPAERKLRDLVRGRCPTPRAPDGPRRALEVMSSAEDYDADLADRYGWINRALPADELEDFAGSLARRIARFPAWATPWSRPELTRSRLRPRRISSRLRSVWRVRAYPRGAKAGRRRDEARPSDPRRGIGPGPDARGLATALIETTESLGIAFSRRDCREGISCELSVAGGRA